MVLRRPLGLHGVHWDRQHNRLPTINKQTFWILLEQTWDGIFKIKRIYYLFTYLFFFFV